MANFGVGVYLLTVIWMFTLLLCWISVRTGHYIGKLAVVISVAVTLTLIALPKGEVKAPYGANFYDNLFVPRYAILTLLLISAVVSVAYSIVFVCMTPVETRKIKNFASTY